MSRRKTSDFLLMRLGIYLQKKLQLIRYVSGCHVLDDSRFLH